MATTGDGQGSVSVPRAVSQFGGFNVPEATGGAYQQGVPDRPTGTSVNVTVLPMVTSLGLGTERADLPKPTSTAGNGNPETTSRQIQQGVPDLPRPNSGGGDPRAAISLTSGPQLGRPGDPMPTSYGAENKGTGVPVPTSGKMAPDAPPVTTSRPMPQATSGQAVNATENAQGGAAAGRAVVSYPAVELPQPNSGARLDSEALEAIKAEGLKAKAKGTTDDRKDALLEKKPSSVSQQATHVEAPPQRSIPAVTVKQTVHQVREALTNLVGAAGIHSAVVTLADESLGEVRIKVTSRGKRVDAEIVASDEAVRTLLRTHRHEFELAVTQKGFELGSFQTGREGGNTNQAQAPTTSTPSPTSRTNVAAPVTASRPSASDNGLDVVI